MSRDHFTLLNSIEKLNGSNYVIWSHKVKNYFEMVHLFHIIENEKVDTKEITLQARVKFLLMGTLSENLYLENIRLHSVSNIL